MSTTLKAMTSRLREITEAVAGLPAEKVRATAPHLLRERASLENAIAAAGTETTALAAVREAEEVARRRAEDFPRKLDELRSRAFPVGEAIENTSTALLRIVATVQELQTAHSLVLEEGRAIGSDVPRLAQMIGISDGNLERLHVAASFLAMS